MTRDEVRAAAARVVQWHRRFAPWFGRKEAREHSLVYLNGLLSDQQRKSAEPIALRFARGPQGGPATQKEVVAMQGFITASPWEADDVFAELQAVFAEELLPTTSQGSIGTVGVIDESGFVKAGVKFQSKPQIASEMIRRTRAAGKVRLDWVVADALYGDSGEFLDALEAMGQRYLVEVKKNTLVWRVDPATLPGATPGPKRRKKLGSYRYREVQSVREIAAAVPAESWRMLKLREGAKGPLVCEFVALRVWAMRHNRPGPAIWLLLRRSLEQTAEVRYYVSNAGAETPWEQMAQVSGGRWYVEEFFEDGKMHLGMADYETRSWTSWHHHMALVGLAHLYVTLTKRDMKRGTPELTLDMALRLLRSAFARPKLSEEDAIELVEYHLKRNHTARESHRKSWLQKHQRIKPEVLL